MMVPSEDLLVYDVSSVYCLSMFTRCAGCSLNVNENCNQRECAGFLNDIRCDDITDVLHVSIYQVYWTFTEGRLL